LYQNPPSEDNTIRSSGVTEDLIKAGNVAEAVDVPSWIQLLGGSITTAFMVQIASVLPSVDNPSITCNEVYADTVLSGALPVDGGCIQKPDAVGIGVDVDDRLLEKYAIDTPPREPDPDHLMVTTWPDHPTLVTRSRFTLYDLAVNGEVPFYEPGVETQIVPEWNSDDCDELDDSGADYWWLDR
jgi:hypothetical protein